MDSRGRISELAAIVQSKTNAIEEHLAAEKLLSPSFSSEASPLPSSLSTYADDIWDATTELQALVDGPLAYLTRITNPAVSFSSRSSSFTHLMLDQHHHKP